MGCSRSKGILIAVVWAVVSSSTALAQVAWSPSEDVKFKFGVEGQVWADENQNPQTQGYAQNLFVRRLRLMVGGEIGKDLTFFVETDDPNLGKTPKALGSGFLLQDAFLEWKVMDALRLDGGLMIAPVSRNILQSTLSYYTLDLSPITTVSNLSTQSSGLRDTGFQARGFFLDDHLLYRVGVFQGQRNADGRNSLRSAGYVQYDFFTPETSYAFSGTTLGKTKLLAVNAGVDAQGSYRGYSADVAAAIPVQNGNEIGGQIQYFHYDGHHEFTAISQQNDYLAEAAYYLHKVKLQPFVKTESQAFVGATAAAKDIHRYGGGVNYYVHAQNLKWTFQYTKAIPVTTTSTFKPANEFTMQLQLFYF